ncbi:hypothetical protein PoB_004500600 [Plakobranchus ocellatus]|uniref:Uncharacterized protein n=1 Tax=Plakobranchus ocellatus TaxID=259542 RepID=A0AAV4BDK7_9GAST|nr:hypothetical protein PoB_004500600 [Plakobranchus ocellatus]
MYAHSTLLFLMFYRSQFCEQTMDDDLQPPAAHGIAAKQGVWIGITNPLDIFNLGFSMVLAHDFFSWEAIQQWFPLAYCWFVNGFFASLRLTTNPQSNGDLWWPLSY